MIRKRLRGLSSLRKRYISMISSIVIMVLIVVIASLTYTNMQRDRQLVSDVLADQRVLVKTMMSSANRISVISDSLDTGNMVSERERLEGKLVETRKDLELSVEEYQSNLDRLLDEDMDKYDTRFFLEPDRNGIESQLESNSNIWNNFKGRYETILENGYGSPKFLEALVYVNENTENLLDESTDLAYMFLDMNAQAYSNYNKIVAIVILIVGLLIIAMLYEFYKYMFLPLGELYSGFEKMGFDSLTDSKGRGVKSVTNEISNIMNGIIKSMELTEEVNSSISFDESLEHIYESFKGFIPYSYIGIALFKNNDEDTIIGSYGIGKQKIRTSEMAEIIGYEVSVSTTSLKKIIETGEPRIINDLESHMSGKYKRRYNEIIFEAGVRSSITLPLNVNNTFIGFIFFSSDEKNVYNERHIKFLNILSNSIAMAFQKNIFIEDLLYSSLLALTKISEEKDQDTGEHLARMKNYCVKLAKLMKKDKSYADIIDSKFIVDMGKFSPMHDIGKVGIPDRILLKPGKLDKDEFEVMKTHTQNGARVLQEAENNLERSGKSMFQMGIKIAESHHEKWDGSGYPHGLSGEDIPIEGRIVALADVLDALLSKRPYKEAFSFEKAKGIILEGKGRHFDPDIVDIFEENIGEFKSIYERSIYI